MRGYNCCTQLFKQNRRVNDLQLNQPSISLKKLGTEKHLDNKMSVKRADPEVIKWNTAMSNYMRNGQCEIAIDIFNFMPRRSLVSWNTMISGYLRNGKFELARQLFDKMPQRDTVSWNLMINGYVRYRNLNAARLLFEKIPEKDIVSWNSLLSGYARNGYVKEAKELFERMPIKNSISWNGLLAAYVHNGKMDEANMLFDSKKDWDLVSWNCLMGGYVKKMRLADARKLFDRMPERDVVSWNIMISGYALHGDLSQAQKLFDESPSRDVFTWTTMISGFVHHGLLTEGRRAFDMMPEKNAVSWNSMIAGYVQCKKMDLARALFDVMPCKDISSWNTVISGYAQSGDISQARSLFDNMPQRDSISWSAMIAGYAKNGKSEEALRLFVYMIRNGELLNKSVVTCVLSTCADIGMLELGKQVHGCILKTGFDGGTYIGNALLAMYCKCGCIGEAHHVFEAIRERDCVSWNTMIAGLAKHGFGKEALVIFGSMAEAGVKPDDVTMVGVLSACSHTGLVDRGRRYFYAMYQDYGIIPNPRHYTCMIDLLGRAGKLEEAQNLVDNMPFEPDAATWGALLGASRIHGNIDLAEKSAKIIFEMDSNNAGMYVLLSNLYAASDRWNDVRKIRLMLWDKGVKKVPGYSWLEVQNKIHIFSVADSVHPDKDRIYALLEELDFCMKRDGYMCTTKLVLHDVDEEEKEHMLKYHSERLAVAFGILTIPTGKPIRVMKNLRVCADCHTAIKHIAKLVGRLIILRDSNRFHHFRGGTCSCGDYW